MSVFGIDFGNLNSTVAITRYGGIDIVTNEVSKRETTTIVSFLDEERFIGEQGLDRYVRNAQNTVFLLKRFIGMRASDPNLPSEKRFVTCQVKAGEDDRLMFGVNYCGETQFFYPEQVLAMMLQRLRTYVNEAATTDPRFPADVRDCVITVPSYYTADQRRLMYQAAEVAGLHCMSLLNETTAASVDYGIFRGTSLSESEAEAQVVGVLDIGYAATDFSIVKFWRGNCKVLSRTFDRNNGTRDVDWQLYEHMVVEVQKRYHVDVSENRRARLRLLQACERLKYLLSANSSAPLNVENIMDVDVNIPNFERAQMESLSTPFLERVKAVLERGFAEAGVTPNEFHSIEMIGGGCRIPMLKRLVEEILGKAPSFTLNASETTARGSAVVAAMLSPKFQVREFRVAEIPTYPILLGYYVENPKSPSAVEFLPDVNKVVTLLGAKDTYPKLLDVTIPRSGPFKLYAFVNPDSDAVKNDIQPGHYVIGEWDIGAPIGKAHGVVSETRVRINIRPDGMLYVEGATALDSYEVEEAAPAKKAAAPADAENAKNEEEPTPKDTEGEEEKQTIKKKKTRNLEATVKPNAAVLGHPSESVVAFRKQEKEMHDRDCLIVKTREKKNELESYILDFRPRFAEGGALFEYVTADQRTKFVTKCDEDEQWLYEDGESASLEAYDERVKALRAIGDGAQWRHRALDEVEFAMKGFLERMAAAAALAEEKIGKAAHITEEELRAAAKTATDAAAWAQAELAAMQAAPKTEEPRITVKDLQKKTQDVEQGVRAVVNRPAPPPPKPAAPAPADDAKPKADAANEEAAAAAPAAEDAPNEEAAPAPNADAELD